MGNSIRQLTLHDGSDRDPTKGDHYGIIAIDRFGVEHHSAYSNFPHSIWCWSEVIWWRYDDATTLEMMTWQIAEMKDKMEAFDVTTD